MVYKGILRGDTTYRHFTFDDKDVIKKGSESYYKVNYGKNPLEGDAGEDEIGYVPCDKVMVLGGKKPQAPATPKVEEKPVPKPVEEAPKPKRGRPKKVVDVVQEATTSFVPISSYKVNEKFEYYVDEFHLDDVHELQKKLNELGNEGWELCGFDTYKGMFKDVHIVGVFKRRRG